ncbi:Tetratricopeptide repeat protein [Novipirellula galeiformis]|uniref:Tetratricopeptide repeat protein n=1 Tax=Novipirellula galeiformis TaxID=2528004 RepID=A0A5C6C8Z9_9BACT|nr:tetratricopeptide repeat-containing glycosyltransferase family protein [Novipirellula galeiformis]TWU20555.1 Tetratricopeptide repeat protein [Novipirellula galeiformis]
MPSVQELLQQGWQRHQSGQLDEAMQIYRHVLAHAPRNADALVYLGIAFFDQRDFEQSVAAYRDALAIRASFPIAWNNLGNSLRMLGRIDEAEQALATALKQKPGYLSALKNRGTLWIWAGEIERGLRWYEEGLVIDPRNAELHRNLGVINLLLGNDEVGWREYRWRWAMPGTYRPQVMAPVWQGEDLGGKSILLYPEQGRGDAIQFVRVAAVLKQCGATVYVQCAAEMMPLIGSTPGIELLLPSGSVVPPIDYHASFLDVVDFWYQQTGELAVGADLFAESAGYLSASGAQCERWAQWMTQHVPRGAGSAPRRIGINWQGNPEHHADVYRSLSLESFRPLTTLSDCALVSLQFGYGTEQLKRCDFADSIVGLPAGIDATQGAFTDTAAILRNLDVVVTSDTAIAHLAGALGVEVIVMLGKVPDWRWRNVGERTPWYPSMKLMRQTELGQWSTVMDRVVQHLSETR